jgi:hypothetical protein
MLNCRPPLCTSMTILFFFYYIFLIYSVNTPNFCIYVHATNNINLTRTEHIFKFNVCKSVHHHTIQINQPTRCSNLSSLLLDVYVGLNMFWASSHLSSGAQHLPLVLPLECGDSSADGCGRANRPDHNHQHCYHHALMVKPEAATAVVDLLNMGVRTPETC